MLYQEEQTEFFDKLISRAAKKKQDKQNAFDISRADPSKPLCWMPPKQRTNYLKKYRERRRILMAQSVFGGRRLCVMRHWWGG